MLERTSGRTQRGVAILVSGASLRHALGARALDIVERELGPAAVSQSTSPHAWWDVYSALRKAAEAEDSITIVEDTRVLEVWQAEEAAYARTSADEVWRAEVLIGADGYRSVTRRHVDDTRPDADYAGYVVWLGQSEFEPGERPRTLHPDFMTGTSDMLAVYPLIGRDGQTNSYGWGWFDPNRNRLLREVGAVSGRHVMRTPRTADIPEDVYDNMALLAESRWEEPWATGVAAAFRDRQVIATPISEYVPDRVVSGRVALVGDAAHPQTPMTGAGFSEAVTDAGALADTLTEGTSAADWLQAYEFDRLKDMRRQVMAGQSFSRSFAGD